MKKGDIGSNIIMWIAILTVVIVVANWFVSTIRPLNADTQVLEFDAKQIFIITDTACNSVFYNKSYNPRTEEGTIIFNNSIVCLNYEKISHCKELLCSTTDFEADLSKIIEINFLLNKTESDNITITAEDFN